MAEAFAEMQSQDGTANLTHAEWLGLLIDRESSSRETKRFESRMRTAKLRHVGASPEDVDYKTRRGLDKALFRQMLTGRWIKDRRNLMITGPCGGGKTWLACALAQATCRDGVTVLCKRMPRLFDELELAHGDGRFPRLFKALTKTQLLILDDWGPDRLDASQRRDLMKIVEDRYEVGSTLITSQLPIGAWHDVIGEPIANEQRGEGLSVRGPSDPRQWHFVHHNPNSQRSVQSGARGFRNRSQALNAVLRGRCGFLDVGQGELADFSAVWRQAKDVSDDVRTLAKAVVLGKLTITAEDRALLRAVGDLTNYLSREMGRMKDAARDRHGHGFTHVIEEQSDA